MYGRHTPGFVYSYERNRKREEEKDFVNGKSSLIVLQLIMIVNLNLWYSIFFRLTIVLMSTLCFVCDATE